MSQKIRILLADDHAVVRQGFKLILGAQPDMEIVGEAGNGREAVELAEKLHPDVAVMDVAMPELNGIEATRRMSGRRRRARACWRSACTRIRSTCARSCARARAGIC